VTRAKSRVLGQYQAATRFNALVGEVGLAFQELEDALWGLVGATAIDTATGIWLDRIGVIVNEGRGGASDASYRGFLRARIRANRSNGTVEDVLAVLYVWDDNYPAYMQQFFPASFELTQSGGSLAPSDVPRVLRLVKSARAAGVGVMFIYQTVDDASAFTFSTSAALESSSTTGFGDSTTPATGGAFVGAERV
jgi:hypothetical protein